MIERCCAIHAGRIVRNDIWFSIVILIPDLGSIILLNTTKNVGSTTLVNLVFINLEHMTIFCRVYNFHVVISEIVL